MEEYFLVVIETMNKFLASAGVLTFPCPSRRNPGIWSPFGPGLQNLISHDSL